MKASDISDETIYGLLAEQNRGEYGSLYLLEQSLPSIPRKVLLAKLEKMIRRKRLFGCPCGCDGGFSIPPGCLNIIRHRETTIKPAPVPSFPGV